MRRAVLSLPTLLTILCGGCETFQVPLEVVTPAGQGARDGLDHLALTADYGDERSYTFISDDTDASRWSLDTLPPGNVTFTLEGRVDDPALTGNSLVISRGTVGPLAIGPEIRSATPGAKILFTRRDALGVMAGALDDGLQHHAWSPAPDGGVVVFGGRGASDNEGTRKVLRFRPTGPDAFTFTEVASMGARRRDHAAVPLPDGRVLITGTLPMYDPRAHDGSVLIDQDSREALEDAREAAVPEIYDPADDSITPWAGIEFDDAKDNAFVRGWHTLTLLPEGRVLMAGGVQFDDDGDFGIHFPGRSLLLDPAEESYEFGPNLGDNRFAHTATALEDGRVLLVGGRGVAGDNPEDIGTAEIFDPTDDSSSFVESIAPPRGEHGAVRLADGRVLVFGGSTNDGATALGDSKLFLPGPDVWADGPDMLRPRWNASAALSASGRVLVCGGADETGPVEGCELFVPGSVDGWIPAGDPGNVADGRDGTRLVPLGTGDILGFGGTDEGEANLDLLFYRP